MLLDQIHALTVQIATLTTRVEELLAAMPDAQPTETGHGDSTDSCPVTVDPDLAARCAEAALLSAVARLDEVPGIGPHGAQVILAEIGLDMTRFPTPGHLVSWAKLCPRTIQSGPVQRGGKTGKGNPYLKGALGEAAAAAAKTNTFLGERYRRIVKRRGKLKALVAVARSILAIIWHLLTDPAARFRDLAPTTTPTASTPNGRSATTSPNSPRWATGSPSNPPRKPRIPHRHNLIRLRKLRRVLRLPTHLGIFRSEYLWAQSM